MNRVISSILLSVISVLQAIPVFAQIDVRPDDHFYRRRIVNRIDLREKINQPIIRALSDIYPGAGKATNKGLIAALVDGLERGEFVGYHPDDFSTPMTYEDVLARMQDYEYVPAEEEWDEDIITPEEGDEWISEDADGTISDWDFEDPAVATADPTSTLDLGPYEQAIQFVEDRIFDKNSGQMIYSPEFIQLIWQDPGETLPQKFLVCFRYEDVLETLEAITWRNRFNDAETRNLREIFEMRLFNSYIVNVSGNGVQSLPEAEQRRQELVAFEHHLWNY